MFQMEARKATARPAAMMISGVALMSTSVMVRMSANAPFHMAENARTGS